MIDSPRTGQRDKILFARFFIIPKARFTSTKGILKKIIDKSVKSIQHTININSVVDKSITRYFFLLKKTEFLNLDA